MFLILHCGVDAPSMLLWLLVVFLLWALAPFCCWFFVWSFFVWTIRKSGWGFALRLAGCWFLVLFIATVVFALYSRDLDQEVRYLQSLTEPLSYISRTRAKKTVPALAAEVFQFHWHPEVSVAVFPPERFCHGNFRKDHIGYT
jgi:ABC-type transport system involved in multi-copper enzyme maturation permease subunit